MEGNKSAIFDVLVSLHNEDLERTPNLQGFSLSGSFQFVSYMSREELNQNSLFDTTRLIQLTNGLEVSLYQLCFTFPSSYRSSSLYSLEDSSFTFKSLFVTKLRRHFCQEASYHKNPYTIQDFSALNCSTQRAAHTTLDLNKFVVW